MKKTLILSIIVFASIACSQKNNFVNPVDLAPSKVLVNKPRETVTIRLRETNSLVNLKEILSTEYFNQKLNEKSLNINSFNFDSLTTIKLTEEKRIEAILINNNNANYNLMVLRLESSYIPILIETINFHTKCYTIYQFITLPCCKKAATCIENIAISFEQNLSNCINNEQFKKDSPTPRYISTCIEHLLDKVILQYDKCILENCK
jgi:hypothetical protein